MASRKLDFLKYFALNTRAIREEGLLINLQACLARSVLLNASISLNPNPPSFFDDVNLSQAIQGIDFLSRLADHQNFLIAFVIFCNILLGSRKHDIVYAGNAVITALRRTSFPAGNKNFEYQLSRLLLIR